MEFPTLKFPKPHDRLEARKKYELGLLDPDGFAATYFDTLKRAEEEMKLGYAYEKSEDDWWRAEASNKKEAYCKRVNEEHKNIREKIDRKMQNYLLSHDGRIDFWPDGSGFQVLSAEYDTFYFHYFGPTYETSYLNFSDKAHRWRPGLEYFNMYVSAISPGSKQYKADEKKEFLKKRMDESKSLAKDIGKHYSVKVAALAIVGLLLSFVAVSLLLNLLFDVQGPVMRLLTAGGTVTPTLKSRIIFLVLSIVGVWGCIGKYLENRDFKSGGKEEEQEYQEYINGPYERELNAEKEREARKTQAQKKDIKLAEEWHRAWFEWAKQVGDAPPDVEAE